MVDKQRLEKKENTVSKIDDNIIILKSVVQHLTGRRIGGADIV